MTKPERHTLLHIVLIMLTISLAACGTTQHNTASTTELLQPDKDQVWQLVAIRGRDVNQSSVVTLILNPATGNLSGKANCNNYYAEFKLRPLQSTPEGDIHGLSINGLGIGQTRCPDADMNAEGRYTALLEKADKMMITAYTLTLYQKGKEILKYEVQ